MNTLTDKTLKAHIKKCGDLKTKIDELTALFNAEKESITTELNDRQEQDFTAGKYAVSFIECMQHRLDGTALKKKYPEIAAEYTKEVTTNRFTVKAI